MKQDYQEEQTQNQKQKDKKPQQSGDSQSILQTQYDQKYQIDQQNRIIRFVNHFKEKFREFKPEKQNILNIKKPNLLELAYLIKMWQGRSLKTDNFILTVELVECQIPLETIQHQFQFFPSINLIFNGVKIQTKGILMSQSGYFYEGQEKVMQVTSDERETEYFGDVEDRIYHGKGRLHCKSKKDSFVYEGSFYRGKMQGIGVHKSGVIKYQGQFYDDFKHGKGVETVYKKKKNPRPNEYPYIVKSVYRGDFKNGYRQGKGKEEEKYGTYEGEWKNGVKFGRGKIVYKNGDQYDGEWENNQFNGEGTYIEADNCQYNGQFKDGKYHGQGILTFKNGDKYEGSFRMGKKHGQGVYSWQDGSYYDGQWVKDSAEGEGTSLIGDDFYTGQFKNGKRHGQGELTDSEGNVTLALWENNQIKRKIKINDEIVDEEEQ